MTNDLMAAEQVRYGHDKARVKDHDVFSHVSMPQTIIGGIFSCKKVFIPVLLFGLNSGKGKTFLPKKSIEEKTLRPHFRSVHGHPRIKEWAISLFDPCWRNCNPALQSGKDAITLESANKFPCHKKDFRKRWLHSRSVLADEFRTLKLPSTLHGTLEMWRPSVAHVIAHVLQCTREKMHVSETHFRRRRWRVFPGSWARIGWGCRWLASRSTVPPVGTIFWGWCPRFGQSWSCPSVRPTAPTGTSCAWTSGWRASTGPYFEASAIRMTVTGKRKLPQSGTFDQPEPLRCALLIP